MTKEELKKEAEEYALENYETCLYDDLPYANDSRAREQAFIVGAEPREKHIAILEKENAELKEKLESSEKTRDYWKESAFDWRHKFFEKRSTKRLVKKSKQLAKAKEIIKSFSEFANNEVEYDPEHPQEHTDLWVKLCEQAEQFLKEVSE